MGNCCGGARKESTYQGNSSKARREQTWHATGTIALRDSNLKVLPVIASLMGNIMCACKEGLFLMLISLQELPRSVAAVGSDAKVLDATNNRLREVIYIESLVNLQRLVLARNQISELPASIGTLQSLKASPALLPSVRDGLRYLHAYAQLLRTYACKSVCTFIWCHLL